MARGDSQAGRRHVARNLRRLRLERKLTQDALADEAGVRQALISELEAGKIDVRLDTLQRIASALGARMAELFDEAKRG
jgi:transcriptional regulator with XRE-family HTH domain